jgi:hypothetical protein
LMIVRSWAHASDIAAGKRAKLTTTIFIMRRPPSCYADSTLDSPTRSQFPEVEKSRRKDRRNGEAGLQSQSRPSYLVRSLLGPHTLRFRKRREFFWTDCSSLI